MITGRRTLDAPPPRATAAAEYGLFNRSASPSPSAAQVITASSSQERLAGVSTQRLDTPNGPRRGIVPVGLHAQRPDDFGVRGRAQTPTPGAPERSLTPKWGFHINRSGDLQDRCMQQIGNRQEALKAFGAHGVQPGIELNMRKGAGECLPRSCSQEPARSMLQKSEAARALAGLGHAVDITVAPRRGQGSCSPHNEGYARFSAQQPRCFERRQEGARTGCLDIDAVPRSALGAFSPKRVHPEGDTAANLIKTQLAGKSANNSARRQITPQPQRPQRSQSQRSFTPQPQRVSWPEPQEYLAMIGSTPVRDRTPVTRERTPGAPRLVGNVLSEIRASVPRSQSPAPATAPSCGAHFMGLRRTRAGPPPRCSSSQVAQQAGGSARRDATPPASAAQSPSARKRIAGKQMNRQVSTDSLHSCFSDYASELASPASPALCPNSARRVEASEPVALLECTHPPETPPSVRSEGPTVTTPLAQCKRIAEKCGSIADATRLSEPMTPPSFSAEAPTLSTSNAQRGGVANGLTELCASTVADMRRMESEAFVSSTTVSSTRSERSDYDELSPTKMNDS